MPIPSFQHVPVLVTGGAGFIGSHLVDALMERGAHVTVLDNLVNGSVNNLTTWLSPEERATIQTHADSGHLPLVIHAASSELRPPKPPDNPEPGREGELRIQNSKFKIHPLVFVLGDIRNPHHCRLACGLDAPSSDPDHGWEGRQIRNPQSEFRNSKFEIRIPRPAFLFHQAALGSVPRSLKDPATTIAVNVGGTANIFAAARDAGVRRVVYASSSSVYGDSETLPKREGEEGRPLSPYALSKVMNEELAESFRRCFEMELIGLRYFNVYGPRQTPEGPYAAVIPKLFKAYLGGEAPLVYGDGEQSRDFTFIADAVRANLLAAGAPFGGCGKAYNAAPGTRTTVNELARLIREGAGGGPAPVHGEPRPGDVRHSMADPEHAREALGFTAEITLEHGLTRTAAWYRERDSASSE